MLHKILWFWFMKRVKDLKDIQRKKRKNGVTIYIKYNGYNHNFKRELKKKAKITIKIFQS